MNRQQLFTAARRKIESRRQQAQTEAALRTQQIYARIPELTVLNAQQADTGALAARLSVAGQREAAQATVQKLTGIKERRALLLRQNGYSEQDLGPRFFCHHCNDTGQMGSNLCDCLLDEVRRLRREEINQSGPLALSRFDTFHIHRYPKQAANGGVAPQEHMRVILRDCKTYAQDFGLRSPSLLLYGDAGLGKTHLALAIASEVLDAGFDAIYVSAQSAFSQIGTNRFSNDNELFNSMLEADLLVLDDLGTEYLDAYILSRLYELVNSRMYHRPTIYTTNISSQELLNQRYTEKIASRLLGDCHPMRFVGKDLRLNKEQAK